MINAAKKKLRRKMIFSRSIPAIIHFGKARSITYGFALVEGRKAPLGPRRVEGDGHVMATCGFTRPRRIEGDGHVIATCGFTRPRPFTGLKALSEGDYFEIRHSGFGIFSSAEF